MRVLILQAHTLKYLCPDCEVGVRQLPALRDLVGELKNEICDLRKEIAEMRSNATRGLNLDMVIDELNERKRRSSNILMFGVPESDSDNVDQRKKHDTSEVEKALAALPQAERPLTVIRLGKPQPGATTARPLKLVMAGKPKAINILKNKSKLPSHIKVKCDQTPYQRDQLKKLREELSVRNDNGEKDFTIKYINGCPRIVKEQKN